ncbi:protein lava lamp-like isoform X2 [Anopheles aquasalis]|uniref:protein lava lamp-like isoform X2 n=1 Tax=Anopheles aquasalis TaxID=42839 RepID=UPI00215B085E|nr:protein lava lamp-like isoform X2 [Anopheles aquasalis]
MASGQGFDADPDLSDLQTSMDKQQAKITELREIIRQTVAVNDMKQASAKERLQNIAHRLTHFKAKATSSRLSRASSGHQLEPAALVSPTERCNEAVSKDVGERPMVRGRSESSGIEKCTLLREQIEQNRLKMAARESSKREIEERVSEIKHKLETSRRQTMERTVEMERVGLGSADERFSFSSQDLSGILPTAINWSSDSVSDAPIHTSYSVDVQLGSAYCSAASPPIKPSHSLPQSDAMDASKSLPERDVSIIEPGLLAKADITEEQLDALATLAHYFNGHSSTDFISALRQLQVENKDNTGKPSHSETGTDRTQESTSSQDECQSYDIISVPEVEGHQPSNVASSETLQRDTAATSELSSSYEQITALEGLVASQGAEMQRMDEEIDRLRQALEEKTIEANVMAANVSVLQEKLKTSGPKPLFPKSTDSEECEAEMVKLKQQLDESNKSMIKCKLKIKQLQKQIDTFRKTSNVHAEVVRLTEEVNVLTQRLQEASQTSAGQTAVVGAIGRGEEEELDTMASGDLRRRIETLEVACQHHVTAMQLLEEQKNDLQEDLSRAREEINALKHGVEGGETGRIVSHMLTIELEEQLEQCLADKTELSRDQLAWETERQELTAAVQRYQEENDELRKQLLNDQKLSIEKLSSAESIEILENLTQHEKQEMEQSEKRTATEEGTGGAAIAPVVPEAKEDLNESLLKLMEESRELMEKVELFTDERREVLEKLDAISIENQAYVCELDKLKEMNQHLSNYSNELAKAKSELEEKLKQFSAEKECIRQELDTVRSEKPVDEHDTVEMTSYQQQLQQPTQPPQPNARSSTPSAQNFDKEDYKRLVTSVENEVASYMKQKDKHKKLQASKKLTACTKQLLTMDKQLLNEYERLVNEHSFATEHSLTIPIASSPNDHERSSVEIEAELAEVSRRALEKEQQVAELQEQLTLALSESMGGAVAEKDSDEELELLQLELNSKNEEIQELRQDIEALVDAKASEMYRAQTCLVEAQTEVHNLKTAVTEWQRKCAKLEAIHDPQAFEQMQQELSHQQDTIRTLNEQIVELYRTIEERDSELAECQELVEQLRDQKQTQLESLDYERKQLTGAVAELQAKLDESLNLREALQREYDILDQKNEELLEKLKKFAANLKKKNVQCSELEKQLQCNEGTIQQLTKTVKELEEEPRETAPTCAIEAYAQVEQERDELADKLHHLNNELHRLLEQKYQLEAELLTIREELRTVREQLALADVKIVRSSEQLQVTDRELTEVRMTVEAHEQELSVRQAKLDKCKAIIKEKIKETQRLQESERRTAYLEDELRMTQCKLEEFHKQTLLLGRLKSEKEELNAAVREEQEHRSKVEQELAQLRQQIVYGEERERHTEAKLSKLSDWLRRFETGWRSVASEGANVHDQDLVKAAVERFTGKFASDAHPYDDDLLRLPAILAESNQHITLLLQRNTRETSELTERFNEQQLLIGTLESELDRLRLELHSVNERKSFSEQVAKEKSEAFERVAQELQEARNQLSELRQVELNQLQAQLEQAHSELQQMQPELQQVQAELVEVQNELEQSKNYQRTVSEECVELRSRNEQQTEMLRTLEDAKLTIEEKMSSQLNSLTADRNNLETELAAVVSEKEAVLIECNQAQSTRRSLEDQLADLAEKLTATEQQLGVLQQQYDNSQLAMVERTETLTLECNRYREDCERLGRELEEMSQQKITLQVRFNEKETAMVELQAALDELRVRHKEATMSATDGEHYKAECEALDQELKCLKQVQQQQVQSSTQTEALLRKQCEELHEECEELKRQTLLKSETQPQLSVAADSCNMWDDQSLDAGWGDTGTAQQDEVLRQKDEHIHQLMVEKELMQGEINELKVRCGKLVRKLKECKAKADNLEVGLASGSEEGGPERIAKLQREQVELLARYDTLQESFERIQQLNSSQAAQLDILEKTIRERDVIANQPMGLVERLSQLCGSLEELQATLAELRPEELSPASPITTTLDSFVQRCRAIVNCVAAQQGGAELQRLDQRQPQPKTDEPITEKEEETAGSRFVANELEQRVAELERSHGQLEQEKSKLEQELDELNQRIMQDWRFEDQLNRVTLELDAKNVELQLVRSTLVQLQTSAGVADDGIGKRESELLDEIDELKDQIKLLEQELAVAGTQTDATALNVPEAEVEQTMAASLPSPMDDPQVRVVLEQQETEIVALQQQLAIRSAEYARLASQIDPARLAATINRPGETASDTQQQLQAGDRVPRAELELALYMVYQRDMRCEELELELQNLLQERDALQLRLSNALRVHEEFRVRLAEGTTTSASSGSGVEAAGQFGECSLEAGTSGSERDASLEGAAPRPGSATDTQDLSTKLSELQSIGYSKEKRRQEEREDRNRQLAQIQRDLANMPLEAAAKIAGTEVVDTEAASQQSASSVLINWILGKK